MIPILIDSGFLVALYHKSDSYHVRAVAFIRSNKQSTLIPDVILPEVAFLLRASGGVPGVSFFLRSLVKANVQLEPITLPDLRRADEIMTAYPAARLDLVDCCIVDLAERLNITQVCTFDRRDFTIIRPKHCDHLELLPQ